MVHRVVDKSFHLSDEDDRQQLGVDLQRAGASLQLQKPMTLGYAIHILSSADHNHEAAEKAHGANVLGVVEQFRGRIAILAQGKVKPPAKVSTPPERRVKLSPSPDSRAVSPTLLTQPVDVAQNGRDHEPAAAVLPVTQAEPAISSSPIPDTNGQLPSDPTVWTPSEILHFLDAVDAREKTHGSLRRICREHNISEPRYHYLNGRREKLQARAAAEAGISGSVDSAVTTAPSTDSPDLAGSREIPVVAAPELPENYRDWNPRQILIFLDHCAARPDVRGSLAQILRTYVVSDGMYHYWRTHREKYEGLVKASTSKTSESAPASEVPFVKPEGLKPFDPVDELGYLPEVLEELGEDLNDPMLGHLAALVRARHEETVAKSVLTPAKTVDAVVVEQPVIAEETSDETSVPPEGLLSDEPAIPDEVPVITDPVPEGIPESSPSVSAPPPFVESVPAPVIPTQVVEAVTPTDSGLAETPAAQIDDTRPKLFELVGHVPLPNARVRTEEARQQDYVTSVTLRLLGSVKADWTYERAVDFVFDHYHNLLRKIFLTDPAFSRQVELSQEECHRLGDAALRASVERFDPMVHGDLTHFLERAVREELQKHPLFKPVPKREFKPEHGHGHAETTKSSERIEAMAMLWATENIQKEVYDYHEFIGVIMRRHMAWVYPLAESLHDPDSGVSVKSLNNAGYHALLHAVKNFEFSADVTYDSFRDAVYDEVESAIRAEIHKTSDNEYAEVKLETSRVNPRDERDATTYKNRRSPEETMGGVLKMHLDSARRFSENIPTHSPAALKEFASGLGVEGETHEEIVIALAARYIGLADEIASQLTSSEPKKAFQQSRDVGRYAIARFVWAYDPSQGDFESGLRSAIEDRIARKRSGQ